jgi:hypothetical protein
LLINKNLLDVRQRTLRTGVPLYLLSIAKEFVLGATILIFKHRQDRDVCDLLERRSKTCQLKHITIREPRRLFLYGNFGAIVQDLVVAE